MKKFISIVVILMGVFLVLFLLIQLVPYGRDHTNPAAVMEPKWNSPETRALLKRACFDCHSNETIWPWYSNVAPVSWLVTYDVNRGREHLNFSEWNRPQVDSEEIISVIEEGEMPTFQYLSMHSTARLNQAEKQALIQGVRDTFEQ